MKVEAILTKKINPKTGKKEWALVSHSKHRALKYFGTRKPSEEEVAKEEQRIQFFKHVNSALAESNIRVSADQKIKKTDLEIALEIIKNIVS